MKRSSLAIYVGMALILQGLPAHSFEIGTHSELSQRAVRSSNLDSTLKERYDFPLGVDALVLNKRIIRWVADGGVFEDNLPRFCNHFHNPLHTWDQAGLRFPAPIVCQPTNASSVLWGQTPSLQASGERFTWQDARENFLKGLTAATGEQREGHLALTFRALGQLIHLVQDAAVPAHTRNDPHPFYEGLERFVEGINSEELIGSFTRGFDPAILKLPPNRLAPVPIARIIDTTDPEQTAAVPSAGTNIGLAEYSNANFLSGDTIFKDFAFPRMESLGAGFDATEPGSRRPRRYFAKTGDGETGVRLVAEGSFMERLISRLAGDRGFILDRGVYEDYARLLLPRAIGYSAGLLDYFFRGRLDADLIEDATDPSVLQLTGKNGSDDPFVDGTVRLYADDPTGRRSEAAPLSSTIIAAVDKGEQLPPLRYQAPQDAERFVAVYQGTLGNEVKSSDGSFPGGVIGKVLGGVRVEELFSDGTEWKIRTPKGVFGFEPALSTKEYELAKWGDARDLFVARTRFGPEQPNRVDLFEIDRLPNTIELRTVGTGADQKVPVRKVRSAGLPENGIATGTVVNFHQSAVHRQTIIKNEVRSTFACVTNPNTGQQSTRLVSEEHLPPEILPQAPTNAEFNKSIPLVLDAAHLFSSAFVARDYHWFLMDITVDATGRIMAVVLVDGLEPDIAGAPIAFFGIDKDTGAVKKIGESFLLPRYPSGGETFLWALVDVDAQRTIMKTAEAEIVLSQTSHHRGSPEVWFRRVETGGCNLPSPRTSVNRTFGIARLPGDIIITTGPFEEHVGEENIVMAGLFRDDLKGTLTETGFAVSASVSAIERTTPFLYHCTEGTPRTCLALEQHSRHSGSGRLPAFLEVARRPSAGAGGERLVLLAKDLDFTTETPLTAVAVMEADPRRTQVRYQPRGGLSRLSGVTTSLALVIEKGLTGGFRETLFATTLVPLDGSRAPIVFPEVDLSGSFRLLEQSFLYNIGDLKFYRLQSPLQPTVLPAKLANLPSGTNPIGDYHSIRVP